MKQVYGVIGDPISHSLSPEIHNDAFTRHNINAYYLHFHVTDNNLEDAIKGMKALGVSGFNVTIPHKTAIIPLLDEVDGTATAIGAVNTVVNRDGRLIGYNTDGTGFLLALKGKYKDEVINKKVLIVGAGGAARGIFFTFVKEGITNVDIANRTIEKARKLVRDCPYINNARAISISDAESNINDYDIVVQTTSVGMSPKVDDSPIRIDRLRSNIIVSDIIYNPLKTKLLKEAELGGASTQNGLGMFVYQAALAFEIWTGIFPDVEKMKHIVMNKLGG
jgi:shikimate dehydrogenase